MIKLGRIEIITEVSLLSSHVALPREGHIDAAVHTMTNVSQKYNSDWCMTLLTQKKIKVPSRNVIGQSSIRILRRQYP